MSKIDIDYFMNATSTWKEIMMENFDAALAEESKTEPFSLEAIGKDGSQMKAVIEVTDCRDCPYAKDYRGHGECWKDCQHSQHNQGAYGNILWGCQASFKATPSWCPLKEQKE